MLRMFLPLTMVSIILPAMAGCSPASGCDEYRTLIRNLDDRAQLVQWADDQIFSRTFGVGDFEKVESFVGPGKGGGNFVLSHAEIKVPSYLEGYTIRSVGPNKSRPNVIFLGKRRYQGLLITRDELIASLNSTTIDRSRVDEPNTRMAMMCYTD